MNVGKETMLHPEVILLQIMRALQKLKNDYLIATAPQTRKTAILHMQPILLARDIAVDLSYPTKKEIKTYFFKIQKS